MPIRARKMIGQAIDHFSSTYGANYSVLLLSISSCIVKLHSRGRSASMVYRISASMVYRISAVVSQPEPCRYFVRGTRSHLFKDMFLAMNGGSSLGWYYRQLKA